MKSVRLSSTVSILRPQDGVPSADTRTEAPQIILLLTWMDASPKHVSKYAAEYRQLYPNATILLISSSYHDFLYRPRIIQRASLKPAVSILAEGAHQSKILVHLFSNGGGLSLVNLCELFLQQTGRILPLQAIVMDSSPGRATLTQGSSALLENLPRQRYIRLPLTALLYPLFFLFWLYTRLQPSDILETVREELNDTALVTMAARRLYIYSADDKIVDFLDVEDHIDDSRQLGYKVVALRTEAGGHVGHMRQNPALYWESVENFWMDSCTYKIKSKF